MNLEKIHLYYIIAGVILVGLIIYITKSYQTNLVTIEKFNNPSSTFPPIIFQTWKTHKLPHNFQYWSQSWKQHHPTYQYLLWDDMENRQFVKDYYPNFIGIYDSYDATIKRADAIRYFFL